MPAEDELHAYDSRQTLTLSAPFPSTHMVHYYAMSDFQYAIEAADVRPGTARPVQIGERWYAICNDRGTYHATDNTCPHANGPMGHGDVENGCLVCPIHAWPFDLKTGLTDPKMPWMRLKLYRCQVREGKVYVDVSGPLAPPMPSW